jgi:hypothetical protein
MSASSICTIPIFPYRTLCFLSFIFLSSYLILSMRCFLTFTNSSFSPPSQYYRTTCKKFTFSQYLQPINLFSDICCATFHLYKKYIVTSEAQMEMTQINESFFTTPKKSLLTHVSISTLLTLFALNKVEMCLNC